jgi:outer membrane protein TolC
LKLEMGRYETGIDPYLDVVIAQTILLNNQQALINSQVARMTACVQLIAALGGGWDKSQLPTPAQVAQKPTKAESSIQH